MAKKKEESPVMPALIELRVIREASCAASVAIRTPDDASRYADELRGYDREVFAVIPLNARNYVCGGLNIATIGILDASLVNPAAVFKGAMLANAAAVILLHNHPSGDSTPSAEDIRITRQLIEAGKILDLKVLDHVILGNGFISMREEGIVQF